jgi:hypothetical protein
VDPYHPYDNTLRQILFNILKPRHIPDTLLKATVDVYTQSKIIIKFHNKLSKLVEINKGVRQGYPLSPTLFNIQDEYKLLEYFVPVAVCTGTTAVVSVEFSSL